MQSKFMDTRFKRLFFVTIIFLASPAHAACDKTEYRQFDFWLSEWDVKSLTSGKTGSINTIVSLYDGCVIREEYTTPSGYSGMSINFYDTDSGRWHQTWMDNQGSPLFLSGGLVDGKMVLESDSGRSPAQRITWSVDDSGSVRQHWEQLGDNKAWKTVFHGLYTKRPVLAE